MYQSFKFISTERLNGGQIVRIHLDRPEVRNAQSRGMLLELDEAMTQAERDDQVRVIILAATGPAFSAGHDLGSAQARAEWLPGPEQDPSFKVHGGTRESVEGRMLQEWHYYFQNTLRWRNLRKITIAQVHGQVYSAGLMLMWACDLIAASDDTEFADIVGTRLGMCGVEYFAHPWELGARRTKEMLLTGDSMGAEEAQRIGMVSKVFPRAKLEELTLAFAERVAARPTAAALMVKESVNQTADIMGFTNALQACFSIHQLNHAHWAELNDGFQAGLPHQGVPAWADADPVRKSDPSLP